MKFILFFILLLLNYSSYAAMNVKLPRGGSKNIKFSKDIDMCTSLYNTIDFICGQSNIFINIKDTNNSDRIVVIFKNGTQELINVSREISEARIKRNHMRILNKSRPDKFRIFYQLSYGKRYGNQDFFHRRHRLSIDNQIGNLFWNVNLFNIENNFTEEYKTSSRVFFDTTLRYKKLKFFYGNTSVLPIGGTPLLSARIYGGDLSYRSRRFFVNVKSGDQGVQYNVVNKRLNSLSFGHKFGEKLSYALSYGQNNTDDVEIYGLRLGSQISKDIRTNAIISESSNEIEENKKGYIFDLGINNITKNDLFHWRQFSLSSAILPDGFIYITGNSTDIAQSRYSFLNEAQLFIPEKYGKLFYKNFYNLNNISTLKSFSNSHSLSYNYDKFYYSFRYVQYGNNLIDYVNEQTGHSLKYREKGKVYDHLFGVSYSTTKNKDSINYTTGAIYNLIGNSFSWNNRFLMTQQEVPNAVLSSGLDNIKRNYMVASNITFKDKLSLDQLGFGFQSSFNEDETNRIYNSQNNLNLNMSKEFNKRHNLALDLRYGANNTYDGLKEFKSFAINYTYKFKTRHNIINKIIYNKNKTIFLYNDLNYNNEIDEEDELLNNVNIEVYDSTGEKFGSYTVVNGKVDLKDIDKRMTYFVTLKDEKLDLITSSFSYEKGGKLFAQSFYDTRVNILDINNDERVSTAELTVRCLNISYTRKFTGSKRDSYELRYPRGAKCLLSIEPLVDESYYDLEYVDILPEKDNSSLIINLKRYSKMSGYVYNSKSQAVPNKIIRFKGKKIKTDEFGYYEFKFKKGEIFKVDVKKDIINKNKSLKNCTSKVNFITFSKEFLLEKRNDFSCR